MYNPALDKLSLRYSLLRDSIFIMHSTADINQHILRAFFSCCNFNICYQMHRNYIPFYCDICQLF